MHPSLAQITVNVNGTIFSGDEASVSVFDRSYLYGDSLYEVVRSYETRLYGVKEHLSRLLESAKHCNMELSQDVKFYESEMVRTIEAFRKKMNAPKEHVYVRIVVSRGTGKIGFGKANVLTPTTYTIYVQKLDLPTAEKYELGYHLRVVERLRNDPRALPPAMKSGNYLNNILGYFEAVENGAEDALFCDHQGFLTEGSTFNIFYVKRGIIATPPVDVGILDGITKNHIIQVARKNGFEVREVRFTKERLFEADEVFLSSSIREAFPVTKLNGKKIGNGKPGPVTRKLGELFHE